MHNRYGDFISTYSGVKEIDYFLAKSLADVMNRADDELLFFSVLACSQALREGHSCLQLAEWAETTQWEQVTEDDIRTGGYQFPSVVDWEQHLSLLSIAPASTHPIVYECGRLYLRRYWHFEDEVVNAIKKYSHEVSFDHSRASHALAQLFGHDSSSTHSADIDWQKVSVANALGKQFCIVTGGPGTGKTTTVTKLLVALCEVFDEPFIIKMVAPTGKAAQRLTESIGNAKAQLQRQHEFSEQVWSSVPDEAMTIHRLLGVIPRHHQFRFNESNRLSLDILLVDEASMVDLPLMARLFRALPEHARVILLGDSNQLPSVAAGSVLADIAPDPHPGYSKSNAALLNALTGYSIPVTTQTSVDHLTKLTKSYRFKDDGGIGQLAKTIITGDIKASWTLLNEVSDELSLTPQGDFNGWLKQLAESYYFPVSQPKDVNVALQQFSGFRFLAATRGGERGVDAINIAIDRAIKRHLSVPIHTLYYHGCPIMINENSYETGLFNGDIGIIWRHEDRLQAAFPVGDGEVRWLSLSRLPSFELVYAMTIHKTQGSEFNRIAIVLPEYHSPILSRELIYTGVTRAKNGLEINCTKHVWSKSIKKRVSRNSGLFDKLYRDKPQIDLF
ncbi:exodeoxyribonuclease V subunit alpha [Alkalimarinus alittae]|uniref:RecBCD enzyme subunit RecD n=1 Tax=Alkalimarinus alittae TaxID=2961619 RepID=A0ABY6MXQ2_9ALTE|nr:exodeoxyribonuclease V subunit alpha [Alkalimarinus alittae]UZE94617.1 exodeoxyribonuclease V subunit alpha [Alkalimarinus alittae]